MFLTDQTTITDLEQVDYSPENPFPLGMTTRTGPFEVDLDAFLSEKYLEQTRINLDKGWNILNLGREIDLIFHSSKQRNFLEDDIIQDEQDDTLSYNTIIFDVAGSGHHTFHQRRGDSVRGVCTTFRLASRRDHCKKEHETHNRLTSPFISKLASSQPINTNTS